MKNGISIENLKNLNKRELIEDFRKKTEESELYIYNLQLDEFQTEEDFNRVKYILVGDSPGATESELHEYFSGDSGKPLLEMLNKLLLTKDSDDRFLILNKSPYSHFEKSDEVLQDKYAKESQEYMAILLYLLYVKINKNRPEDEKCPIWIFGDDSKKVYKSFYTKLSMFFSEDDLINEHVYVFSHPKYGNLYDKISPGENISNLKKDALTNWEKIKHNSI